MPNKEDCLKILVKLDDFKNEKCEVETTLNELGVEVRFTPKAHCELAGRGIEYIWGVSKKYFVIRMLV